MYKEHSFYVIRFGEESGCSQYYTTSDQLLHVPHNNIITDELNYVCVYLPTDSRYAVTSVSSSLRDQSRGVRLIYIVL